MSIVILLWSFVPLVIIAIKIDRHLLFRRQVELVKEILREELQKVRAEKLATPGGKVG